MQDKTRTIVLIACFALGLVVVFVGYNFLKRYNPLEKPVLTSSAPAPTEPSQSAEERQKAPDFTVTDSDGNEVTLSSLYGKPIVLNFWASWCSPCKEEMPDFNKVYLEMGEDVQFMMVDMVDGSGRETKEKGEKYVEENGFEFPVYYDTKQEAANAYGVSAIPTSVFIDKDGYIVTGAQGAIDESTLRKGIDVITVNKSSIKSVAAQYNKITPEQAKEIFDTKAGQYTLLDVRTQAEFDGGHIESAVMIPDFEIADKAAAELPDKDALILVYCRSGKRSAEAAKALVKLGYTSVYDFGGIIDWPFDIV